VKVNRFWPRRPSPEGFSINKIANNYQQKISDLSFKDPESSVSEEIIHNEKAFIDRQVNNNENLEIFTHWANRDFFEYHEAA